MEQNLYIIVCMAVQQELQRWFRKYAISKVGYRKLEGLCTAVQHFFSQNDCQSVNIGITGDAIALSILCADVFVEHPENSAFTEMLEQVDSCIFSRKSTDTLQIDLTVKGCFA